MSLIDTDGRSGCLRTRAQNCAMTSESAPRSWKKLAVIGTSSCFTTAARMPESRRSRSATTPVAGMSGEPFSTGATGAAGTEELVAVVERRASCRSSTSFFTAENSLVRPG